MLGAAYHICCFGHTYKLEKSEVCLFRYFQQLNLTISKCVQLFLLLSMIPIQSLLFISVAKKLFQATFDYSTINDNELTLKVGDTVEFLGDEEEGWYKGQLRGETGVYPSNFVEEFPTLFCAKQYPGDGKQLPPASVSEIHCGKPPPPTPREGGTAASLCEDPTPLTSAGETD